MHGRSTHRRLRTTLLVAATAFALLAAGCGNADDKGSSSDTTEAPASGSDSTVAGSGEFPAVSAPGVTATEIKVGGVASVTNPLGGSYGGAFDGVQAYFDMVNASGGIYGRKLVLDQQQDDGAVNNKSAVDALIASDIFAVMPVASLLFTGADDLVKANVPTFGWTINPEWAGTPEEPRANLFGQTGSYLGFTDARPNLPYLIGKLKKHKIGVLAYSVPQSADCAEGVKNSVEKYGKALDQEIAYMDKTLSFGEKNLSVQVGKMRDAGVDMVTTCMDTNGVVTLATEMDKQGMDAGQYLPNGYDHDFVEQYGDLFEGTIVRTDFAIWELPEKDQPKGLKDYQTWMKKAGKDLSENSAAAWVNAAQFVEGLEAAGPEFDRQKLIDAVNTMTAFTADGMVSAVDWTKQHTGPKDPNGGCDMDFVIKDGAFEPEYSKPGKPFLCIDGTDPSNLEATNQA
jgi:ABC-type branched-subunit amino acid transport system substrate-binding protein